MNTKFIKYLIVTGITVVFLLLVTASSAITHSKLGEIELNYKNFTFEPGDVCTVDDNWCNKVGLSGKAIVYGSIETEIKVPKGTKDVDVWIHIPCNSLDEGLYGGVGSFALISVDNESKPEVIKSSDRRHHDSYYRYEYCKSFLNSFNVLGDRIVLKIEMNSDARLAFEKILLKFYDGENESEFIIENESVTEPENYSINYSINYSLNYSLNYSIDSDNDGIYDIDDYCPEIKGPACNNGCPAETDVDVDGLQEDNPKCQDYDKYPYDQDNDGIPTVRDCDDNTPKNTKIKGDDDADGVSNCIDKCPDEKGGDTYGCLKVKEILPEPAPIKSMNWNEIAVIAILIIILILILILIIFFIRK